MNPKVPNGYPNQDENVNDPHLIISILCHLNHASTSVRAAVPGFILGFCREADIYVVELVSSGQEWCRLWGIW